MLNYTTRGSNYEPGNNYEGSDDTYSRQFFTISRRGHTSATAECGAPTMVWHVAFWPRRMYDPFSLAMTGADGKIKEDDAIVREFGEARRKVVKDFNDFLKRLQARGRHLEAPQGGQPFELREPRDWDADTRPFEVFDSEATGFTLWWPDNPPAACGDPPVNVMSGRDKARPVRADLRVRVQAEVSIDYSIVTFFIDAGKPWNEPPIYVTREGEIIDEIGERRSKIFRHVKNTKTICEERLEAVDHEGKRLIDLDRLPEPNPVCGTSAIRLEDGHTDSAEALKAAADYLYDGIWAEFCRDFGFSIDSIAGETDVIFANFRGLVMSTCGTEVTEHGKLVRAPEPKDMSETSNPGSMPFPRFDGGDVQNEDKLEANAVVKAYMPFMRRFRAEGDWRDWIACGIFDWRAIYITAVGAQSEFAAFDESDFDLQLSIPASIPAGYIPARRVNGAAKPEEPRRNGERRAPTTAKNDRPAPFRYMLLTKFEPHRKQAGRMADRVNSLGARRLFALKDWSVIQNASVWINHYGRQLDAAFEDWIRKTDRLEYETGRKRAGLDQKFWPSIQSEIDALGNEQANSIRLVYLNHPRLAIPMLRRLISDHRETTPAAWTEILKSVDDQEEEYRRVDGDHDAHLAEINRAAEHALIRITDGLDKLGDGAIGGLPYRIARSRYYADTFRAAQLNLRVGPIETWWSYDQFAKRGMEPVLKFIDSVGERLDKLRTRLQTMKQDILQRSIALQTEATRDNTHRLERIQSELKRMADLTEVMNRRLAELNIAEAEHRVKTAALEHLTAELKNTMTGHQERTAATELLTAKLTNLAAEHQKAAAEHQKATAENSKRITEMNRIRHLLDIALHSIPNWITAIVGLGAAAYAAAHLYLFR